VTASVGSYASRLTSLKLPVVLSQFAWSMQRADSNMPIRRFGRAISVLKKLAVGSTCALWKRW